jgi:hypothetical protein
MRLRLGVLTVLTAALIPLAALTTGGATAAPPRAGAAPTVNITPAQSNGALNGVFTLTGFALNDAGQLVANGTFTGTATSATGAVTTLTNAVVSSVVTPAAAGPGASCQVLDLTLGPLHLDLLGLVVDLNQVHLNITAQQGPGNLLGNLLCSVTHLLDNTGANGGALQNLINRLNAILAGLGL